MKNVEMQVKGNKLVLEVDLTKDFGPSSSGKTVVVGTTAGSVKVPGKDEISVTLTVYKK